MTRFDELQQARAMLIRLLDDGKPLPPVHGVDELSPDARTSFGFRDQCR